MHSSSTRDAAFSRKGGRGGGRASYGSGGGGHHNRTVLNAMPKHFSTSSKIRQPPPHHQQQHHGSPAQPQSQQPQPAPQSSPAAAERPLEHEGIYQNARVMHATTSLIGSIVQVQTKDNETYEGVLKTFSPHYEIALGMATEVDPQASPQTTNGNNVGSLLHSLSQKRAVHDTLLIELDKIVRIVLPNVDLTYATRGFTDTDISQSKREGSEMRELEAWEDGDRNEESPDGSLDDLSPTNGSNATGWSAEDMFKLNREKNNVPSTFDGSLDGIYTVAVKRGNEVHELMAAKIAAEIEGNNGKGGGRNLVDEKGDEKTEEELYSSVIRDPRDTAQITGSSEQNWRSVNNRKMGQKQANRQSNYSAGTPSQPPAAASGGGAKPSRHSMGNSPPNSTPKSLRSASHTSPVTVTEHVPSAGRPSEPTQRPGPPSGATPKAGEVVESSPDAKVDSTKQPSGSPTPAGAQKDGPAASETPDSILEKSKLNPNAKEFSFNPNAKVFTPRTPQPAPVIFNHNVPPAASPAAAPAPNAYQMMPGARMNAPLPMAPVVHFANQFAPLQLQPNTVTPPQFPPQPGAHAGVPRYQRNNSKGGPGGFPNQGQGPRAEFGQSPHNVAAATGHPVLAAPLQNQMQAYPQPGAPATTGMYSMPVYINHTGQFVRPGLMHPAYGEHLPMQYFMQLPNMAQQTPHTASSTPQSQTPSTPLHGGPPTPTPVHPGAPNQAPNPQPAVMFTNALPPHSGAATGQFVFLPGQIPGTVHPTNLGGQPAAGTHHNHIIPSSQAHVVHAPPAPNTQHVPQQPAMGAIHGGFQNPPPSGAGRG